MNKNLKNIIVVAIITLISIIGVSCTTSLSPYEKAVKEFLTGVSEGNVDKVIEHLDLGNKDVNNEEVKNDIKKEMYGMNQDCIKKYGKDWIKNISVKIEESGDEADVYIKTKDVEEERAFKIVRNGDKYTVD